MKKINWYYPQNYGCFVLCNGVVTWCRGHMSLTILEQGRENVENQDKGNMTFS